MSAPWQQADAAQLLSAPGPDSNKYSRGVLGLRTGSSAYPGAAVLGAEAAWRTGIGLVRYFPPLDDDPPAFGMPSPASAILAMRPETVFSRDRGEDRERCDAWLLGSGTDPAARSFAEREALRELLAGQAPAVVDAGALDLVPHRPAAPVIVTPHRGEFRRLWIAAGLSGSPEDTPGADRAAAILARELGVTVLLKGSRTIAAAPSGSTLVSGPATPWLATAGTGDVLAGILGALIAAHATETRRNPGLLAQLGVTASLLHDTAARIASGDTRIDPDDDAGCAGAPIPALDVAHALPRAIALLRG